MSHNLKSKQLGVLGEKMAVKYLKEEGYKIIARNYQCKYGEIDIVVQKNKELILVEVKTRRSVDFGSPEEAVTQDKLEKIMHAGYIFQVEHNGFPEDVRIDVIAIELDYDGEVQRFEHLENVWL